MSVFPYVILEVKTNGVPRETAEDAVRAQTGGGTKFWCPDYLDGQPYNGHAHVSPPAGASNVSTRPINLRGSKR